MHPNPWITVAHALRALADALEATAATPTEPPKGEPAKAAEPPKGEPAKAAEPPKGEPSQAAEPPKGEPSQAAEPPKGEPSQAAEPPSLEALIAALKAHAAKHKAKGGAVVTLKVLQSINPNFTSAQGIPPEARAEVIAKLQEAL